MFIGEGNALHCLFSMNVTVVDEPPLSALPSVAEAKDGLFASPTLQVTPDLRKVLVNFAEKIGGVIENRKKLVLTKISLHRAIFDEQKQKDIPIVLPLSSSEIRKQAMSLLHAADTCEGIDAAVRSELKKVLRSVVEHGRAIEPVRKHATTSPSVSAQQTHSFEAVPQQSWAPPLPEQASVLRQLWKRIQNLYRRQAHRHRRG